MPIRNETADSLQSLLAKVLEIAPAALPESTLWFRGVCCDRFDLIPKIMRAGKTAEEVDRIEKRLVTRFRQRSLPFWPDGYPQSNWDQLFAMQHYGMATRLLDWTENVFIAAYFALYSSLPSDHGDHECAPAIWCVDPVAWNRATPALAQFEDSIHVLSTSDDDASGYEPLGKTRRQAYPVSIYGIHNSPRIAAQRGAFMVWGQRPESLQRFAEGHANATLWKITITGVRAELQQHLRQLGFTEVMVFPELQYLAKDLMAEEGM